MIKIGANFLFCLSSCAMLHFKDQVSPTLRRGRPETQPRRHGGAFGGLSPQTKLQPPPKLKHETL